MNNIFQNNLQFPQQNTGLGQLKNLFGCLRGPQQSGNIQNHQTIQGTHQAPQGFKQDVSIFDCSKQQEQNLQNPLGLVPEEQELLELGVPFEIIFEGDDAIMNFATENNITLPEKKNTHSTQNTNEQTNPLGLNPQEQALYDAGVPSKVIKQGDDAIMKYSQDNNINLPDKQ